MNYFNVSLTILLISIGSTLLSAQSVSTSPAPSSTTTSTSSATTSAKTSATPTTNHQSSTSTSSSKTASNTTSSATTTNVGQGGSLLLLPTSSANMIRSTGYVVLVAMVVSLLLCLCCCLLLLLRQRGNGGGGSGGKKKNELDWDYKTSNGNGITSLPVASFSNESGLFAPGIPPITPTNTGFKVRKVAAGYTPALGDELELKVGDKVTVLVEYDDGWCQGINHSRGGAKGVFPKHCLEPLAASS